MTNSMLNPKDWSAAPPRRALGATEIVSRLARLSGWQLSGDGAAVAIEKRFEFADYFETLAFINALAWIAHRHDHHPELLVHYNRCTVRFNTHDAGGITATDFDCAAEADSLVAAG